MNISSVKFFFKNRIRALYYIGLPYLYWLKSLRGGGCLPDFLIVGVQKGGTTSLYNYLLQHPDIISASRKEVHYFDRNSHRNLNWYKSHFLRAEKEKRANSNALTGECTPYYSCNPYIPERIANALPEVKIIFILREPVARAFSHYKHNVNRGLYNKKLSFQDALAIEDEILPAEKKKMSYDKSSYNQLHDVYSLKERGKYAEQINSYREFFPDSILVLTAEELFDSPPAVLKKVCSFLDLAEFQFSDGKVYNQNPQKFDQQTQDISALEAYFKPYNLDLEKLVGKSFNW